MATEQFLLLHGLGSSSIVWEPLIAQMEGVTSWAPDLPGHGKHSSHYRFGDWNPANFWSMCFEAGDWSFVVMHSAASALLPELVSSPWSPFVVLLEGNLILEDAHWSQSLTNMDSAAYEAWYLRFSKNANMAVRMGLQRRASTPEVNHLASGLHQVNSAALIDFATLTATRTRDGSIKNSVGLIPGQVLYLRGARSPAWGGWPFLAEVGVAHAIIEGASHHMMIDSPRETWEAISEFWRKAS